MYNILNFQIELGDTEINKEELCKNLTNKCNNCDCPISGLVLYTRCCPFHHRECKTVIVDDWKIAIEIKDRDIENYIF